VRLPGAGRRFLLNSCGTLFSKITASSLLRTLDAVEPSHRDQEER
jgi:hypothetical protein